MHMRQRKFAASVSVLDNCFRMEQVHFEAFHRRNMYGWELQLNAAIRMCIESSGAMCATDSRPPGSQEGSKPVCLSFR
jgi:hypothetical protein